MALRGHFSHVSVCKREEVERVVGGEDSGRGVSGRQGHHFFGAFRDGTLSCFINKDEICISV